MGFHHLDRWLVFCSPGETYKGKKEDKVAREYTKMAIEDYDEFISFEESYLPHVETPDYVRKVAEKENRDLKLTLFAKQPMTRVGNVQSKIVSTSYLFNPTSEKGLLPDLDVVEIGGGDGTYFHSIQRAAWEIADFYAKNRWNTGVVHIDTTDTEKIQPDSKRFESLEMLKPEILREMAQKHVDYDLNKLYFK